MMLIEIVGCSGAGKTTLTNAVLAELKARGMAADVSTRVIGKATGTAWISNDRLRNFPIDAVLLPWIVKALICRRRYFRFALSNVHRGAASLTDFACRLRSLLRAMGSHELLRSRTPRERVLLVDEGNIGSAHTQFAFPHPAGDPKPLVVRQFASMVPAPDLIIHVDVPLEVALRRTCNRPDPPIRRGNSDDRFERFLSSAQSAFREIAASGEFEGRLLTIPNDREDRESLISAAARIADFIVSRADPAMFPHTANVTPAAC